MEYAARVKYSIIRQYPYLMNFVMKAYYSRREEVSEAMKDRITATLAEVYSVFFKNIHFSGLRMMSIPGSYCRCRGWRKVISRIS